MPWVLTPYGFPRALFKCYWGRHGAALWGTGWVAANYGQSKHCPSGPLAKPSGAKERELHDLNSGGLCTQTSAGRTCKIKGRCEKM